MLVIKNLSYSYSAASRLTFPEWEVADAGQALLLGPSGSGKTTFLHILSGLRRGASGSVTVNGTELLSLSGTQLDRYRGEHIGFVFQKPHLIPSLTVQENVELANFLGHRPIDKKKIASVLAELQIDHLARRKVHEVSQGQAQRIAIARALINEPALIIGDEPTASLDDESCAAVLNLLKEQASSRGSMLIIATHDQRVKSEFSNQLHL